MKRNERKERKKEKKNKNESFAPLTGTSRESRELFFTGHLSPASLYVSVVYCDYTASGRSLQFLEDYIVKEVLPCLGDTRASTSICNLQSSLFR